MVSVRTLSTYFLKFAHPPKFSQYVCFATHCESDVQSLDGIATRLLR